MRQKKKSPKPSPFSRRKKTNLRAGFREAKNETRREKGAKRVFRAILREKFFSFCENFNCSANKTLPIKKKLLYLSFLDKFLSFFDTRKNFFTKLRKTPIFWGKKLCFIKKRLLFFSLFPTLSSPFFKKANTPSSGLLRLGNLLGFLGCCC